MTDNTCEFCYKKFFNKYNLDNHKKTAKFCIKIQQEIQLNLVNNQEEKYSCEYCEKIFNLKHHCDNHKLVCKNKNSKDNIILQDKINKANKTIEKQNKQIELLKNDMEKYKIYKSLYEEERQKNLKLEDDIKSLASKAIENAGNKTINNTTNRNKIIQNLQPLTDDYMRNQTQYLTYTNVKNGIEGIAEFASNYTFKDRLYCSDVSRLNFIFKNENNEVIKDPEGIEITKKFIDINRDELLRLLQEYLDTIIDKLFDQQIDQVEYGVYSKRREEVIATRNAVKKGYIPENTESYNEFKRSFLSALSGLVAR